MATVLSQSERNRRKLLMELGKSELAKPDRKQMLGSLGYDGSKAALDPARNRPPVDNTHGSFQKWVQAALNVVLGTKLRRDGVIRAITRAAIKRFQRREGITAHGYVDETTLQVLELRVGMQAPRSARNEALPHLLMLPRKGLWKPPSEWEKDKKKGKKEGPEPAAAREETPGKVSPGFQQREAEAAVAATAFDEEFVARAVSQRGTAEPAQVHEEMTQWLDQAYAQPEQDSPHWLQKVRLKARGEQVEAASIIRRQWWQEHVGGEDT